VGQFQFVADIFLSYSRDDRPRVERLAQALVQAGYSVWWDRNLTGGERFQSGIQAELSAAKAVIVVWTKTSVNSDWVADEAGEGRDTGRLVPVTLDGAVPPLGFRQLQGLDFSRWKSIDDPVFGDLRTALARLIDKPAGAPVRTVPGVNATRRPDATRRLMIGGVVAAALVAFVAVMLLAMRPTPAKESPRLAFFGFVASDTDPLRMQVADIATTEVFEALSAQQVRMSARSETLETAADRQFARAAELGARFTLSGVMKPEAGNPEQVRVAVRLEDVTTRATLWEDSFVAAATEPLPVAVRAATLAGDAALCVIRTYSEMARSVADEDLLPPLATYCGGFRGNGTPESNRALGRLAELAPEDGEIQANLAWALLDQAYAVSGEQADPILLQRAEQTFRRAERLDPRGFFVAYVRYSLATRRGRPLAELESILKSSLQTRLEHDWQITGYQIVNGYLGASLGFVGRFEAAIPYLRIATDADPFSAVRRRRLVETLVFQKRTGAAEALSQLEARWPSPLHAETLFLGHIVFDAGDARQLLASPPMSVPAAVVACWRDIHDALQSTQDRAGGIRRVKDCLRDGSFGGPTALLLLTRLGDLDSAFELAQAPEFSPRALETGDGTVADGSIAFFVDPTRTMRADPRFLPLMERLGLMEYWRATNTQPDVCRTEAAPFCAALKLPAKTS
jgi:TolB-like protein/tetratricopeptide (TPR) repeat protein